jgi:hypothetical protein
MVERRAGWIEHCSAGAASEASTRCRHYRASAVAPGRKWPCRDDRLRSAEFGHADEDAAAERNLANGIPIRIDWLYLSKCQSRRWRNVTGRVAMARLRGRTVPYSVQPRRF